EDGQPHAVRQGQAERADAAGGGAVGNERHDAARAQEHEQQRADELGCERPQKLGHDEVLEVVATENLRQSGRRNTTAALIPPNPNELVSTTSGAAARPSPRRQSRSQAGSGRSRLMVGGSQRRSMASAQIATSIRSEERRVGKERR